MTSCEVYVTLPHPLPSPLPSPSSRAVFTLLSFCSPCEIKIAASQTLRLTSEITWKSWSLGNLSLRRTSSGIPLFAPATQAKLSLVTSSIKREIRPFPVVVVQWRQRNVQKSVMNVQSCCFAYSTDRFFDVLVVVAVVASQSPHCLIALIMVWSRDLGGLDE